MDIGQAISQNFKFASQVGRECEALAMLVKKELSEVANDETLHGSYRIGEWSKSVYRTTDEGWVYSDMASSLAFTEIHNVESDAYLSFQVSLICSDIEAGSCAEPLVHINFWKSPVSFRDEMYMGFPMEGFSEKLQSRFRDGTVCLLRWESEDDQWEEWTYTLRLAGLNTPEDVKRLIASPVEALLKSINLGEEMLSSLPEVARYKMVDCSDEHYYQVIL